MEEYKLMANQDNPPLKLGIIGYPLSHTKSPAMQKAGLEHLGIDGSYEKFEIEPENFDQEFSLLINYQMENLEKHVHGHQDKIPPQGIIHGLNVTIPHKETVLHYADESDPLVERIGAANTLIIDPCSSINGMDLEASDTKIYAHNTDYYGFLESLNNFHQKNFGKSAREILEKQKVSVLGAGGAAKAVLVVLDDLGVAEIEIFARNIQKAQESVPQINNAKVDIKQLEFDLDLSNSSLVVNCTPIGQGQLSEQSPLSEKSLKSLDKNCLVYDLIYPDTKFLNLAQELDLKTINGNEMLILQGAKSLSLWTEEPITDELVQAMRDAFNK